MVGNYRGYHDIREGEKHLREHGRVEPAQPYDVPERAVGEYIGVKGAQQERHGHDKLHQVEARQVGKPLVQL